MREETTETQPQAISTRWIEEGEEVKVDITQYDRVYFYWFTKQ